MRDRRALSSSGKRARATAAVVWMAFPANTEPARPALERAWAECRGSGIQSVSLTGAITRMRVEGSDFVFMGARYGPVHGNYESDYFKKARRVALHLGARDCGVLHFVEVPGGEVQ